MVISWQSILAIFFTLIIGNISTKSAVTASPSNWKVIASLAENYPYIVALLNETKNYSCTGSIINKRTVITSGSCIIPAPKYIAAGAAILSKKLNPNNIFNVAYTALHGDYTFELREGDPNITKMHSNIGLVFAVRPVLELFIPSAVVGNYYASELKDKKLIAVGYGLISNSDVIVLQQQSYHQSPCANPKWYYCICGIEYSAYTRTYEQGFGKGAPVLFGAEVIGITASPCGLLTLKTIGIKYNIFTVIGPYMPWIEKIETNSTIVFRANSNSADIHRIVIISYVNVLLIIIKVLN